MGGFLDMLTVVGVFGHADFGLQNFHQLLNAVFLSAQLLEGLQDFSQFTRSLVVCEAVTSFRTFSFMALSSCLRFKV
jgi:hypothetical protein